jgi:hypothetical protein
MNSSGHREEYIMELQLYRQSYKKKAKNTTEWALKPGLLSIP